MATRNNDDRAVAAIIWCFVMLLSTWLSFGFALFGEPWSYWLWHDILGVI